MADALESALLNGGRRNTLRLARVTITQVSPLTVRLQSGDVVPGLAIVGLTYTVGGFGVAMIAEGIVPVVLPTV